MRIHLLFLFGVAWLLGSCWPKETPANFTRPVKLSESVSLDYYDKDFVGVVSSSQSTNLAFQVGGLINRTYVDAGSYVKRGQILASLEPQDYQLQLEADRAQYQTSKSILERNERLAQRQAISTQDLEIARSNYQKAKSAYEYSKNQLGYTKLLAPFNGSIEEKYADDFQKIAAGEKIFRLISPDLLQVKFTLPESDVNITHIPALYSVEFDNLRGKNFRAEIKEVVDASVNGTGIPVTLAITDPAFNPATYNIKAGFACRVKISLHNRPALMNFVKVPLTALFAKDTDSTELFVWIYNPDGSTVTRRTVVSAGLTGNDQAILRSGIKAGEQVVTAGVYQLIDGQKVKVLQ